MHPFYVNSVYQERVASGMSAPYADSVTRTNLEQIMDSGSALWIDKISKIHGEGLTLESVCADAASKGEPPLVVVVLCERLLCPQPCVETTPGSDTKSLIANDLNVRCWTSDNIPNRDCHAMASNGELCCQYASDGSCMYTAADESCRDGLRRYKQEYVNEFASILERYATVPTAIIIEPDSIANLATNMGDPNCGNSATQSAYVEGIRYAIDTLHRRSPRSALYLDAGHGGWLGWPDKVDAYLQSVAQLGQVAGHLRGYVPCITSFLNALTVGRHPICLQLVPTTHVEQVCNQRCQLSSTRVAVPFLCL